MKAAAAIEYLCDGRKIFGAYYDACADKDDIAYGICPPGGIMADSVDSVEVMGADAG